MNRFRWFEISFLALALLFAFQNCGPGFESDNATGDITNSSQLQGDPANSNSGATPTPIPTPGTNTLIQFSPTSVTVGSILRVTGSGINFNDVQAATIGGVNALVISKTATSVGLFVMPGTPNASQVSISTASSTAGSTDRLSIVPQNQIKNLQGTKIVGASPTDSFGIDAVVSSDGNTVAVVDIQNLATPPILSAHIFVRSIGNWVQQGQPLRVSCSSPCQSSSMNIAISADGNTILLAGAYVFTRSGLTWSSATVLGSGEFSKGAMSSDGNTVINEQSGVRIFVRSNGSWSQQGPVLTFLDSIAPAATCATTKKSFSLSADGNTALIGDRKDNSCTGSAWIFQRGNGIWSQLGSKFASNLGGQGYSVALSADGNIAVTSAPGSLRYTFKRNGNVWLQQGGVLNASCENMSLNADGSALFVSLLANLPLTTAGNVPNRQSANLYSRQGASWVLTSTFEKDILPFNGGGNPTGASISADGSTIVFGATVDNNRSGSGWIIGY